MSISNNLELVTVNCLLRLDANPQVSLTPLLESVLLYWPIRINGSEKQRVLAWLKRYLNATQPVRQYMRTDILERNKQDIGDDRWKKARKNP